MSFDFENTKPHVPEAYLPAGDFVVTILSYESDKSKNGHPQLMVEVGNELGSRKDYIIYNSEFGQQKLAGLFVAAGIEPKNGMIGSDGILVPEAAKLLDGKKVGTVIREESYEGKLRPRIQGYMPADAVKNPGPIGVGTGGGATASSGDKEIPF